MCCYCRLDASDQLMSVHLPILRMMVMKVMFFTDVTERHQATVEQYFFTEFYFRDFLT